MKTTINYVEPHKNKPTYPRLMATVSKSSIYLLLGSEWGMLIYPTQLTCGFINEDSMTPFTGQVTLEND